MIERPIPGPIIVTLALAGLSEDRARFRLRNELFAPDGKLAARVISTGAWLDLAARKLTAPPESLAAVPASLGRTDDFEVLQRAK